MPRPPRHHARGAWAAERAGPRRLFLAIATPSHTASRFRVRAAATAGPLPPSPSVRFAPLAAKGRAPPRATLSSLHVAAPADLGPRGSQIPPSEIAESTRKHWPANIHRFAQSAPRYARPARPASRTTAVFCSGNPFPADTFSPVEHSVSVVPV